MRRSVNSITTANNNNNVEHKSLQLLFLTTLIRIDFPSTSESHSLYKCCRISSGTYESERDAPSVGPSPIINIKKEKEGDGRRNQRDSAQTGTRQC